MKTLFALAITASLLLFSLTAGGCIGARTKVATQFPAAELAWPGVQGDYLRGVADGQEDGDLSPFQVEELHGLVGQLGAALEGSDLDALRGVPWITGMQPWAYRGIQDKLEDGEVGPTVATELRERIVNFTATVESLQSIYP